MKEEFHALVTFPDVIYTGTVPVSTELLTWELFQRKTQLPSPAWHHTESRWGWQHLWVPPAPSFTQDKASHDVRSQSEVRRGCLTSFADHSWMSSGIETSRPSLGKGACSWTAEGWTKSWLFQWPRGGLLHLNRQQLSRWGRVGNLIRAFIPLDGEMCLFKLLSLSQPNALVLAGTPHQSIPKRRLGLWKQISTLPSVLPLSFPHRRKQDK